MSALLRCIVTVIAWFGIGCVVKIIELIAPSVGGGLVSPPSSSGAGWRVVRCRFLLRGVRVSSVGLPKLLRRMPVAPAVRGVSEGAWFAGAPSPSLEPPLGGWFYVGWRIALRVPVGRVWGR